MIRLIFITAICGLFTAGSCGTNNSSTQQNEVTPRTGQDTSGKPVETRKPNTSYKPAFAGQTRIASVKTSQQYQGKVIAEGLSKPWAITVMPDGRFIISEKTGSFKILKTDGSLSAAITGIPPVNSAGQGGLLDVALDPDFESNRMLYWTFTENVPGGNHTSVAKGKLSADEKMIEAATVIYRATPAFSNNMHYGSRILFDKAGNIIISTGERSDLETRPLAQDLNTAYGKTIRITREGQPTAGNPFIGKSGIRPEIYTYGHRNPQGLAFHPVTGDLWESEMGPRGGDEINIIRAGNNYGWPDITYGIEYSGDKVGPGETVKAGMEQPVYYWDPVLSPSGMIFYSNGEIAEWNNNLFICGLNSNHIARLKINNNKVVGEERILPKEGQRFRDISQGKDGALYAVTDAGRVYRIGK